MKAWGGPPFDLMQISKIDKWQKNLVHSFYYILYQPKGVPSSRDNFSGLVVIKYKDTHTHIL